MYQSNTYMTSTCVLEMLHYKGLIIMLFISITFFKLICIALYFAFNHTLLDVPLEKTHKILMKSRCSFSIVLFKDETLEGNNVILIGPVVR